MSPVCWFPLTLCLSARTSKRFPAMFQNVWHLRIEGVPPRHIRRMYTDFDGIRMARSEVGIGTIDEPTYDKIITRFANASKSHALGGHSLQAVRQAR